MIKLIVSDLDGTLLTKFKSVSERNKETLLKAQALGVKVALATGRGLDSTRQFIPLLKLDTYKGYMILNNGQRCMNAHTSEETVNAVITQENARAAFRFAKEHGLQLVMDGDHGFAFYTPQNLKLYRDIYLLLIRILPHFRVILGRIHIFALFGFLKSQHVKIINVEEDLNEDYDKIGFTHFKNHIDASMDAVHQRFDESMEIMRVSENWLDVSPKGITKLYGIKKVMEKEGLKDDEVMVLGDSENDLTMLSYFPFSVAMGNADSKIKEKANYTTLRNTEDGVAAAIERFVLNVEHK